jgi:hypothetical protein
VTPRNGEKRCGTLAGFQFCDSLSQNFSRGLREIWQSAILGGIGQFCDSLLQNFKLLMVSEIDLFCVPEIPGRKTGHFWKGCP